MSRLYNVDVVSVRPWTARVIGRVAGPLTRRPNDAGESTLGDVVADAIQVGTETWGGNVAALISPTELHYDLPPFPCPNPAPGPVEITLEDALRALPLRQSLITISLTGADLCAALEQQFDNPHPGRHTILQVSHGLRYRWDPTAPPGRRVDPASVTINGTPVVATTDYRVTISTFLWAGGDGFRAFSNGTPIPSAPLTGQHLDLLAAYLGRYQVVPLPTLDRITRTVGS